VKFRRCLLTSLTLLLANSLSAWGSPNPRTMDIPLFTDTVAQVQIQGQAKSNQADYLQFQGEVLGEVDQNSVSLGYYGTDMYVNSLRKSGRVIPRQTTELMTAAKAAFDSGDRHRTLRLLGRAVGWIEGEESVENYEVAAAFNISLNHLIFADGETITLTLRPLFNLGHPLKGHCTAYSWLETEAGIIAGTEQKIPVTELKKQHFDFPVRPLKDGVIAVGYRLASSSGETLAQLKHSLVVLKDAENVSRRLQTDLAAFKQQAGDSASPAFLSALDTIDQAARNLEWERTHFDGHWRLAVHPFGPSMAIKADPKENGWAKFPQLVARLRYPEDILFAESLAGALRTDHDALLKQRGERIFAARSKKDRTLLRYRIYVPPGYDGAKRYSLVLALHSGFSDDEFFRPGFLSSGENKDRENRLFRLAQDGHYIIATPNGERTDQQFSGEPGCSDVVDIAEQLREVYSIPTERVFLTSWSTGSYAAWEIAMKYPEHFRAIAPVGGEAAWLNKENTIKGREIPILYSIAESEVTQGRATAKLAEASLHNFAYKEYPGTEHASVWYAALPAIFDFFDACVTKPTPHVMPANK
jgi:poly(3-hydroxybutyrate) depolymerase